MNAVFDFLESDQLLSKEAATARAQRDLQLWHQWDQNGRKAEDLEPLMTSLTGLIRKQSNVYAGKVSIPPAAVHAEFQIRAIQALHNYNPQKAALNTYLTHQMNRGKRFITTYQNVGRIGESRIYKITEFQNAKDRLMDTLGREPSSHELADALKWPVSQVTALATELVKDVPFSHVPTTAIETMPSPAAELMRLLPYDLTSEEKLVYEHLIGEGGKQKLKPGEIAARYNMSPSKISRIKASIAAKAKNYTGGLR
jgi:DNA-directed RNA polymerase specialized sigma subunit